MAEFDRKIEAVVDITRPAFEGIEEFTPKEVGRVGEAVALGKSREQAIEAEAAFGRIGASDPVEHRRR